MVSRWQAGEGLVADYGEFSLQVPEGWTFVVLDSPRFHRNVRRPQKAFSCRWAVQIGKDYDWPETSALRSRVKLSDGTEYEAELIVRPDPRRELTAQRITDLEQGLGLTEISPGHS